MVKRTLTAVAVVILIIVYAWLLEPLLSVVVWQDPGPTIQENPNMQRWHTVVPGDTLWDIASHYYPGEHTGEKVWEIRKLNKLDSANIWPNDCLKLP